MKRQLNLGFCGTFRRNNLDQDLIACINEFDAMLEPSDQRKHLYAMFGLAMYESQVLEVGIKNVRVLVARTWDGKDVLHEDFAKDTLGALINWMSNHLKINEDASRILKLALRKRNFLAHDFFRRRLALMQTRRGCRHLVLELTIAIQLFRLADAIFEPLIRLIFDNAGIDLAAVYEEELEKRRSLYPSYVNN